MQQYPARKKLAFETQNTSPGRLHARVRFSSLSASSLWSSNLDIFESQMNAWTKYWRKSQRSASTSRTNRCLSERPNLGQFRLAQRPDNRDSRNRERPNPLTHAAGGVVEGVAHLPNSPHFRLGPVWSPRTSRELRRLAFFGPNRAGIRLAHVLVFRPPALFLVAFFFVAINSSRQTTVAGVRWNEPRR